MMFVQFSFANHRFEPPQFRFSLFIKYIYVLILSLQSLCQGQSFYIFVLQIVIIKWICGSNYYLKIRYVSVVSFVCTRTLLFRYHRSSFPIHMSHLPLQDKQSLTFSRSYRVYIYKTSVTESIIVELNMKRASKL